MAEQEAREWAEVRNVAISAVEEAAVDAALDGLVPGGAAILADAVLAVCHEEAVNRMADQFVGETRVRSVDFRNGVGMDLEPSETLVANWVAAAKTWLDSYGAVNYTETDVKFGTGSISQEVKLAGEFERYVFILQRVGPGKLTPHQARKRAETECERLRAEVAVLREQLEAVARD